MSYQIKKFIVRVYLRTHFRCAWNLSRLLSLYDQLEYMHSSAWHARYDFEIAMLKGHIPDFVLEHFGIL